MNELFFENENKTRFIGKNELKNKENQSEFWEDDFIKKLKCENLRCITNQETSLRKIFTFNKENREYRCKYCENIVK